MIQLPNLKQLSAISVGTWANIAQIDNLELRTKLLGYGINTGDICVLTNIAPLGGPIAITVHGVKIAIRKQEAKHIWLQLAINPAK